MIGKSVANRPYMNLVLNNTVTDTGTGANTPTNSGVTFTTDQFGRSNMAGEWDANTDYLEWTSTVGNTIATKINAGATFIGFFEMDSMAATNDFFRIFSQYDLTAPNGFLYAMSTFAGLVYAGQFYGASSAYTSTSNYHDTNWNLYGFRTLDNTTNLDVDLIKNGIFSSGNVSYTGVAVSDLLRMGARPVSNQGFKGKSNNVRFYDVTLSDGALKIINNEKGRIRA